MKTSGLGAWKVTVCGEPLPEPTCTRTPCLAGHCLPAVALTLRMLWPITCQQTGGGGLGNGCAGASRDCDGMPGGGQDMGNQTDLAV